MKVFIEVYIFIPLALYCVLYLFALLTLKMLKTLVIYSSTFKQLDHVSVLPIRPVRPWWLWNFVKVIQLVSGTMGILHQSAFPKVLESYFLMRDYFKNVENTGFFIFTKKTHISRQNYAEKLSCNNQFLLALTLKVIVGFTSRWNITLISVEPGI